ncbi:MAG: prepilin-type N-terminal cleavage/methylation domain-containing protein [Acidobacteria bacterium]|nr:prepilin-type N-terminal cleavage/methylation domain-containing protein [Acidobacteriota bacterium]
MADYTSKKNHEAGFSLVELVFSMAVMVVVMSGVMSVMMDVSVAKDTVSLTTTTNQNLRVAMDLIIRDLLQTGQGLPAGRVVGIPSGAGATPVRRPGPLDPANSPNTIVYQFDPALVALPALTSGPALGPDVNLAPTDMVTAIGADSAFEGVQLSALNATDMTVVPTLNISDNPDVARDNLQVGDLIMLTKQSMSTLKYVSRIVNNTVYFDVNDPMNLNQTGVGVIGTLAHYVSLVPETAACELPPPNPCGQMVVPSVATRIRMVTYYIDPTPMETGFRLMRRINARPPTVVAFSIDSLLLTYDLIDDVGNPTDVALDTSDIAGTGACAPLACSSNQIRKVNVHLMGRSSQRHPKTRQFLRNTLNTQVSLRSLALVDRYS